MKKVVLLFLVLGLFIFQTKTVFALASPLNFVVSSPTPFVKVDYVLPHPGLLPDHPLYPLKMLRDRILDFLLKEPVKKTEFLILMADKRLVSGQILIDKGKVSLGEQTISKGEKYLERAVEQVLLAKEKEKNINNLLDKLEKSIKKHIEVLEEVLTKAPEVVKPSLNQALEMAEKRYQQVLEIRKNQ